MQRKETTDSINVFGGLLDALIALRPWFSPLRLCAESL
jgi:hypothetical protein